MVLSPFYRRPQQVASARASINGDSKVGSLNSDFSSNSRSSYLPIGVPETLSFERIINNSTCPPCTSRDFMNFLLYVEHSAENLQFFLWFHDYTKRFAELPASEQALAPVWNPESVESDLQAGQVPQGPKQQISVETAEVFKGTDFAQANVHIVEVKGNPFNTPPRTPLEDGEKETTSLAWSDRESTLKSSGEAWHHKQAADAFETADLKWQPFTIQPFRDEVARIIASYIADGSPRQLNLSAKERSALLHALANTTHPSAFAPVNRTVEWTLRHQAHPNFVRWSICNGNRPRVIFARGLGIAGIVGGLLAAVLITLSSAGRRWRVLSAIGFMIGAATLFAAMKGMCVVLHGMHHRHLRPWELFAEGDGESAHSDGSNKGSFEFNSKSSSETLCSNNSYEDEPWVKKYPKRNLVRKVFDRERWIEEPALRQIQDTIFCQALACGAVVTLISIAIFYPIPNGGYY